MLECEMSEAIHLHPLVFTLQNAIEGCGFLAGITTHGKAVMERDENGEWWMYGVCPGAIAAGGQTTNEAFLNFRNRYKDVLFDIAEECGGFLAFKTATEAFFKAEDPSETARWEQALDVVRRSGSTLPEPFAKLPRKKAEDFRVGIQIERLENKKGKQFKPTNNIQDSMSQAA
jgi:hypothetical protein